MDYLVRDVFRRDVAQRPKTLGWRKKIEMAKVIHCRELFPRCTFVAHGKDETEVLIHAANHLTEVHDLREIDKELLKKARAAMRDVSAEGSGG